MNAQKVIHNLAQFFKVNLPIFCQRNFHFFQDAFFSRKSLPDTIRILLIFTLLGLNSVVNRILQIFT